MTRIAKKRVIRRGKNLTDDAIEQIVGILDGWTEKLTWEALIEAIVVRLHCRYTRQALHKHVCLREAYAVRRAALGKQKVASGRRGSGALTDALARIARLDAENQRLEEENRRLLEQFVVWAYNAHTRGLTKQFLSQPLPHVDRGQTLTMPRSPRTAKRRHD